MQILKDDNADIKVYNPQGVPGYKREDTVPSWRPRRGWAQLIICDDPKFSDRYPVLSRSSASLLGACPGLARLHPNIGNVWRYLDIPTMPANTKGAESVMGVFNGRIFLLPYLDGNGLATKAAANAAEKVLGPMTRLLSEADYRGPLEVRYKKMKGSTFALDIPRGLGYDIFIGALERVERSPAVLLKEIASSRVTTLPGLESVPWCRRWRRA